MWWWKVFILVYQVFRDFIARFKQIGLTCEQQRVIGNKKKILLRHKILYSTSDDSWEKSPSIRGWLDEPVVLLEHDFEYFTFYWLLNSKKAQTKRRSPQAVKMIIKRKWFIKQTLRLLVSCSNVCLGLCVYLFFLFTEDLFEIIRRVLMTILFRSKDDRPCTKYGFDWG